MQEVCMNNKNNILLSILVLCSTYSNFAMMNNDSRYTTIIESFNPQTNSFNQEFTSADLDKDIVIIKKAKQSFEKELADYKGSWAPTFLKLLATGFGLEAGLMALYGIKYFDPTGIFASAIKNAGPILHYVQYATYPIGYPQAQVFRPVRDKLLDLLSVTTYDLGMGTLNIVRSLMNAAIAKYLFNKATSYKNEIKTLEEKIKLDEKIIKSLEALKNQ